MEFVFPVNYESLAGAFESLTDDKEFVKAVADGMNKSYVLGEKSGRVGLYEEKEIRKELRKKIRKKMGLFYPERKKSLAICDYAFDLCMYAYRKGYKAGRKEA